VSLKALLAAGQDLSSRAPRPVLSPNGKETLGTLSPIPTPPHVRMPSQPPPSLPILSPPPLSCTVLPCTEASDIPGLFSMQLVPSHHRELQTTVSTSAGLTSALAITGVDRIVLAPGTYIPKAELSITRSVVLKAAVAGSVVLDAQANSSSRRRVLNINPGSLGVVQEIGLNFIRGVVQVRVAETSCENSPLPRWEDC
jgi:hypothetical protein